MASPPRRRPPSPSPPPPPPPSKSLPLEAEITVVAAKHLKNVNWRHGDLKPYAVLYLDPDRRVATKADDAGSTRPVWNERFVLPVPPGGDALLTLDIFHSKPSETPKPLVGTARALLRDLVEHFPDASSAPSPGGAGPLPIRTLELRRPSGRPQGKVRIKVAIREVAPPPPPSPLPPTVPPDYHVPPPSGYYYSSAPPPPSHLLRQAPSVRDYRGYASPPPSYANSLPPPPTSQYPYSSYSDPYLGYYSSSGYYSAPPVPAPARPYYDNISEYGGPGGPSAPVDYSSGSSSYDQKPRSGGKMGLGAGLAMGAVAGALGGMALEEGLKYKDAKIAERVESDLVSRDDYRDYRDDY
ncbi:hypothetical protein Taro_027524 [Colocasia esculenta]|uniref:C2 domain-containing protein n=1 Tax=Colocasia esculenta TaxID=4460 RepID=A0A843VRR2_COLES|nr:hypothetical protein [Colocasia esculenta]